MTDQTPLSVPEWSNLYKSSTLQGNQAKQHELSSNYTQAFTSYLKAAQSYLFLSRHAADSVKKDQLVSQAKSWVERAEKIKKVLKLVGGGGAVDRLGREEMDRVTEKGGFINGVKYLRWSDEMRKMGVDLPGGTRYVFPVWFLLVYDSKLIPHCTQSNPTTRIVSLPGLRKSSVVEIESQSQSSFRGWSSKRRKRYSSRQYSRLFSCRGYSSCG